MYVLIGWLCVRWCLWCDADTASSTCACAIYFRVYHHIRREWFSLASFSSTAKSKKLNPLHKEERKSSQFKTLEIRSLMCFSLQYILRLVKEHRNTPRPTHMCSSEKKGTRNYLFNALNKNVIEPMSRTSISLDYTHLNWILHVRKRHTTMYCNWHSLPLCSLFLATENKPLNFRFGNEQTKCGCCGSYGHR